MEDSQRTLFICLFIYGLLELLVIFYVLSPRGMAGLGKNQRGLIYGTISSNHLEELLNTIQNYEILGSQIRSRSPVAQILCLFLLDK